MRGFRGDDYVVNVLIDTLSMTWKYDNVYQVIQDLGLASVPWQPMRLRRYSSGQYFQGVVLGWNTDEWGNILDTFLDLSGKGCRTVEQFSPGFDWKAFIFEYFPQYKTRESHISRIDIACDDLDGILDIDTILDFSMKDFFVCKSKILPDVRFRRTEEVYFGSPKSDRLLRIYNKALEQGLQDTHWVRAEFQLRNDNAMSFILNWKDRGIGEVFSGMLIDYLRFLDPDDINDIDAVRRNFNANRYDTVYWWREFTQGAAALNQLYLPPAEFTLDRLDYNLKHYSGSSIKTYLIAHGQDLEDLRESLKNAKLNARQKQLLSTLPHVDKSDYEF